MKYESVSEVVLVVS